MIFCSMRSTRTQPDKTCLQNMLSTHTGIQINPCLLFAVDAVSYRVEPKVLALLLLIAERQLLIISSDIQLFFIYFFKTILLN